MSQRSTKVTGFKTADEIPYAESNGAEIVEIGPVDPELHIRWLQDIVTWDFTAPLAVPSTVAMVTSLCC